MKRLISFLLIAAVLAIPIAAKAATPQQEVLTRINALREENHTAPLITNEQLQRSAAAKAQDMCQRKYFSHNNPDGQEFFVFIDKQGYQYDSAAENLATNYTLSPRGIVNNWRASPSHREAMLDGAYTEAGIAVVQCPTGEKAYAVLHLGHPEGFPVLPVTIIALAAVIGIFVAAEIVFRRGTTTDEGN